MELGVLWELYLGPCHDLAPRLMPRALEFRKENFPWCSILFSWERTIKERMLLFTRGFRVCVAPDSNRTKGRSECLYCTLFLPLASREELLREASHMILMAHPEYAYF